MNRIAAIVIATVTLGAAAAYADDITIDPTPFTSTSSRAQVQAQLAQRSPDVWASSYNQLAAFRSQRTRAEVTAEYLAARGQVEALTAEDSGSAFLIRARDGRADAIRVAAHAQ